MYSINETSLSSKVLVLAALVLELISFRLRLSVNSSAKGSCLIVVEGEDGVSCCPSGAACVEGAEDDDSDDSSLLGYRFAEIKQLIFKSN